MGRLVNSPTREFSLRVYGDDFRFRRPITTDSYPVATVDSVHCEVIWWYCSRVGWTQGSAWNLKPVSLRRTGYALLCVSFDILWLLGDYHIRCIASQPSLAGEIALPYKLWQRGR